MGKFSSVVDLYQELNQLVAPNVEKFLLSMV